MKKLLSITLAVLMLVSTFCLTAFAEDVAPASADVYVTIAYNNGKLVLTQEKITATDKDNDGKITIDEALLAAHEAKYEGGAAAGYASAMSDWGLSLTKLWGVENGGSYGYYVNNVSAMELADEVHSGDYINAFIYTDLTAWSDTFCFFDTYVANAEKNGEITLTLKAAGYDANNAPITTPVEGATITINGTATTVKTNAEGKATIKLETAGKNVISATSDTMTLVPPVCVATVSTDDVANVYVTISNKGSLVMTQEKITVSDADKDGALTVNDALYCAHEAKYEGGAAAGYASGFTAYGLSLTKLWNDASGNFGYYVNNASAWSLADPVKDGDYVNAFVYADATTWSDTYCYFDKNTVNGKEGDEITLILSYAGYDANWNPVTLPVEGATITIDGVASEYKTDADGKVTIKLDKSGDVVIGAVSETMTLVPPVCKASIEAKTPDATTDDNNTDTPNNNDSTDNDPDNTVVIVICVVVAVVVIAGVVFFVAKKKKNEK